MKSMTKKALAATALGCALAACTSQPQRLGGFAGERDGKNIGVAMRAQGALIEGNNVEAVRYAEQAVANKPQDAGFRALLGNAYFASGRFASAEAAYRDSLGLMPAQPEVILKKALVEIAQGKNAQALTGLETARGYVNAADLGLAVALAGRPQVAVEMLETAARSPQATARTRQNLALAHAMSGNWGEARAIAAQDVPANQLDAQLEGWMTMASPAHPSHAIAALTGVTPAQVDPGQPVALALRKDEDQPRYAALAPAPAPAPAAMPVAAPTPSPVVAAAVPVPAAEPMPRLAEAAPRQRLALAEAPTTFASVRDIPVRDINLVEESAEAVELADVETRPALDVDPVAPVALVARAAAKVKVASNVAPTPGLSASAVRLTESADTIRVKAVSAEKASRTVVQLASYYDRSMLEHGWSVATRRFAGLEAFQPVGARFQHGGKTYYRLAAHGFASDADARAFCEDVKATGMDCFVRKMAGDAPTRFAQAKSRRDDA